MDKDRSESTRLKEDEKQEMLYDDGSTTNESESSGDSAASKETLIEGGAAFAFREWDEISKTALYQSIRAQIGQRYAVDKKFQQRVMRSSRSYVESKLSAEVRSQWERIRDVGGSHAPEGEKKLLIDLIVALGQHYLLDTSALLLYLSETDFDTIFYKNPIGSGMSSVLADANNPLQIRERDFNTLGELTDSCAENPPRVLGQIHYLILSKCLDVLVQMNGITDGYSQDKYIDIDSTYDLDFMGRSVVIPVSVRSASFPAVSYNSRKGIEALVRHINVGVSRVCFLTVDSPHTYSDLQASLIRDLSDYLQLAPEMRNTSTANGILSAYFEMDARTGKPRYADGLPVVNQSGDKYQYSLDLNKQYGRDWKRDYLPGIATTFQNVHFKDRPEVFEPALKAQLDIMPSRQPIANNFISYYDYMRKLLSQNEEMQERVGTLLNSAITSKRVAREERVQENPSVEDRLNIFAYLIVVCDFVIQAGLASTAGKLAGFEKFTKADMVDVLTRTFNGYRQLLTQVTRSLSPGPEEKFGVDIVAAPYTETLRTIAGRLARGRDDVDAYVNEVCAQEAKDNEVCAQEAKDIPKW
jgi:hypothetical protein